MGKSTDVLADLLMAMGSCQLLWLVWPAGFLEGRRIQRNSGKCWQTSVVAGLKYHLKDSHKARFNILAPRLAER